MAEKLLHVLPQRRLQGSAWTGKGVVYAGGRRIHLPSRFPGEALDMWWGAASGSRRWRCTHLCGDAVCFLLIVITRFVNCQFRLHHPCHRRMYGNLARPFLRTWHVRYSLIANSLLRLEEWICSDAIERRLGGRGRRPPGLFLLRRSSSPLIFHVTPLPHSEKESPVHYSGGNFLSKILIHQYTPQACAFPGRHRVALSGGCRHFACTFPAREDAGHGLARPASELHITGQGGHCHSLPSWRCAT